MFKGKALFVFLSVFLVAGIILTACQAESPDLEEEYGEEPEITLYMADTGESQSIMLEEYLQGVVAAEMDPEWHVNALAAQAILARTFTLKRMERGGVEERGTDASTDETEFQAYDETRINDRVVEAVEATRGEVATHNGELINSWYHADAGGKTADSPQEGLDFDEEDAPYITSVEDPGLEISPEENRSWTVEFALEEVRQSIKEETNMDTGEIDDVEIIATGPSGRVTEVRIGEATMSGPAMRLALGDTEMRSTMVDEMEISDDKLVVKGKGFGHGVGMSQWGARKLAEEGESPEDIVRYFYDGVEIDIVWD